MPKVHDLHFVCVDDLHVTDRPDGQFSTGYWKISADAAQTAQTLALHPNREAMSTRQGEIVERHFLPFEGSKRYLFVVRPTPSPVSWKGEGSGEKGYGY